MVDAPVGHPASHLGIKSGLHWWLDAVLSEDRSRTRRSNGPNHLAVLRRMALNIMRRDQSKGSKRARFERAAWNDALLRSPLAPSHMRQPHLDPVWNTPCNCSTG